RAKEPTCSDSFLGSGHAGGQSGEMEAAAVSSGSTVATFRAAAERLGAHPQDHGWRELYRLLAAGLATPPAPRLAELVTAVRAARPDSADAPLRALVGIAGRPLR